MACNYIIPPLRDKNCLMKNENATTTSATRKPHCALQTCRCTRTTLRDSRSAHLQSSHRLRLRLAIGRRPLSKLFHSTAASLLPCAKKTAASLVHVPLDQLWLFNLSFSVPCFRSPGLLSSSSGSLLCYLSTPAPRPCMPCLPFSLVINDGCLEYARRAPT